jgi:predicted DNA-binding WGR domain protein
MPAMPVPAMPTPAMPAPATPGMPAVSGVPKDAAPLSAEIDVNRAEVPTHMPGPREIPAGRPDDPASPPGQVPAGDSRSMRRRTDVYEFALIYRIQTYVISRFGVVGTRGQWRVVEYPTSAAAGHAYAKECSRFVSDGFSDYRERGGI